MSGLAAVKELMEVLVHPDARASDIDRARHGAFIATRLVLTFSAVAALAVGFAAGHLPAPWEALALAWATVPLGAATLASRTGRLGPAEVLSLLAWPGFGATVWLGGGLTSGGTCALLLLVLVEGVATSMPKLVRLGGATACFGLGTLVIGGGVFGHSAPGGATHDLPILAPCLIYAVLIALASTDLRARRRRQRVEAEDRRRTVADLSGDFVLYCDRSATVLEVERTGGRRFSLTSRDLLGRGAFERVHVADRPAFLKVVNDAAAGLSPAPAAIRLRTSTLDADGSHASEPVFTWTELRAARHGGEGSATRDALVVALMREVPVAVRHDPDVERTRDDAGRTGAWKDVLIANLSHELRTPLNSIIGFSELLANPDLSPSHPEKRQEYAGIIAASGQHLLSVVNSLLDFSKIEAGRFDLVPDTYDVVALVQACCDMIGLQAERAGVVLRHERGSGPLAIVGDARACRQIVLNLLSNALKFTGRGGRVTIETAVQDRSALVIVEDTGVGIAAADLRRVGDAFFQGRSGYDRVYEGTGLGLSVVRGLVGLHGGRIGIESAVGEGTRVLVHLPLDCRAAKPSGAAVSIEVGPRAGRCAPALPAAPPVLQRSA